MTRARVAAGALAVLVAVVLFLAHERRVARSHRPAATTLGSGATTSTSGPASGSGGAMHARVDGGHGARATVVLSAPWGGGDGQLGRRADPESLAEGPMSFFVDGRGVVVLDNVNRRVVRFDQSGRMQPPIALDTDAAQDLARMRDRIAVLDRLREKRITIYDGDGSASASVALAAAGFADGASVTGIFSDGDGALYAEKEHGAWSRVTDADGVPDAAHLPAPGRPTRAGQFVSAAIVDRAAGRARVADYAGLDNTPAWQATVDFGAPLLFLALLDGDAAGRVYVGAHTGHESSAPPYAITDETLVVVALAADGSEAGRLTLPAPPPSEAAFRDLYVGDDGTIYWMRRTPAGVVIEAYRI